jgi:hypothetical protein
MAWAFGLFGLLPEIHTQVSRKERQRAVLEVAPGGVTSQLIGPRTDPSGVPVGWRNNRLSVIEDAWCPCRSSERRRVRSDGVEEVTFVICSYPCVVGGMIGDRSGIRESPQGQLANDLQKIWGFRGASVEFESGDARRQFMAGTESGAACHRVGHRLSETVPQQRR